MLFIFLGTWYIQTMCEVFEQHPDFELTKLLKIVQKRHSNQSVFNTEEKLRSMPEFHSRLEKDLYFTIRKVE